MSNRPTIPDTSARADMFLEEERYFDATHHLHVDYQSTSRFILSELALGVVSISAVTVVFLFLIADTYLRDTSPILSVGGALLVGAAAVAAILALKGRTKHELSALDRQYISALDAEGKRHVSAVRQL
jgi:hypothetical protein